MGVAGGPERSGVDPWSAEARAAAGPLPWERKTAASELRAAAGAEPAGAAGVRSAEAAGAESAVPVGGVETLVEVPDEDDAWAGYDEVEAMDAAAYQALMDDVAAVLDGAGQRLPAQDLQEGLTAARRDLGRAGLDADETVAVLDEPLVEAVQAVGELTTQLGAIGFTLARDAAGRGLHTASSLSLVDWLRHQCPWMPLQVATDVNAVVTASAFPSTAAIGDAVAAGTVPVHRAGLVARTMNRLRTSLELDQQEEYAGIAIRAAARRDLSDRDLAKVCRRLIEDLLEQKAPGDAERAAQQLRSVSSRKIGRGLTRFTIDAPAGEAATITGVLTSALAAPAPVTDERGEITEPDLRSAGQRRFDALTTVIHRGISHPGAPGSTARSTVMLVIPIDPATGAPGGGPAFTTGGDYVPPRAAAQHACTGEVTPVWVSPEGEPLALGRTARFATPGQWKALAVRDGGCTFPGCTALAQCCDSHHLHHWARGGRTDVSRMVLLCGRHHTHVHQHDLTATVNGGTVTWHL